MFSKALRPLFIAYMSMLITPFLVCIISFSSLLLSSFSVVLCTHDYLCTCTNTAYSTPHMCILHHMYFHTLYICITTTLLSTYNFPFFPPSPPPPHLSDPQEQIHQLTNKLQKAQVHVYMYMNPTPTCT